MDGMIVSVMTEHEEFGCSVTKLHSLFNLVNEDVTALMLSQWT